MADLRHYETELVEGLNLILALMGLTCATVLSPDPTEPQDRNLALHPGCASPAQDQGYGEFETGCRSPDSKRSKRNG